MFRKAAIDLKRAVRANPSRLHRTPPHDPTDTYAGNVMVIGLASHERSISATTQTGTITPNR